MDNVIKDLNRLDLICQTSLALERMSTFDHIKDFAHYYFSRFMVNLTHAFKDFTWSEIVDVNHRHQEKIKLLIKRPMVSTADLILPIPMGMIHSYKDTIASMVDLLREIHIDTIESDLIQLNDAMNADSLHLGSIEEYNKKTFDHANAVIGKQFSKNGPIHSLGKYVLATKADIDVVNTQLQSLTTQYYPLILKLDPLIKKIEQNHKNLTMPDSDKAELSKALMSAAYRLSILAVVMNHLQDIEHSFVKCLNILLEDIQ